ncbi:MAG TPA: L-fucose:H+ symporter permease [Candidatus Akkermansia intestinigallinarum]|uniref:L-fucose:H+ symporter permease n=1 Tax=Candidatus Akkermansia intestinigallinarum TaxID=2838431 RepID=A0A9D2AIB9_9BACT|nr:L-fucose:H+ symporter permease [Candidatus Akkermansia intestinigallinarum]
MQNQPSASEPIVPRRYRLPFILLVTCFALWGIVNAMAEVLVKAFSSVFPELTEMGTIMSVSSHYGAYAVLAIPASILIKKYSYKAGVLLGLGVFFFGVLGYVPAAIFHSYGICLGSIFVYASGCSILETTCNPFVLSMGSQETAVRRLNFAQQFNPVGSLIGLLVATYVIFDNMVQVRPGEVLSDEQLSQNLIWLVTPYVVLAAVVLLLWFAFVFTKTPNASAPGEEDDSRPARSFSASLRSLLARPRYRWGVLTQFFYVGLQTMAWVYVLHYGDKVMGYDDKTAMYFYIAAMCCFIVMRFVCTALMKKFNPASMMALMAVLGLALCMGAVYLPGIAGLLCVVAISGCLSLMFPTIYGIALRNLGQDSKLGAAGLVMAILGGAAIPPVFAYCLEHESLSALAFGLYSGPEAALRSSYYVLAVCLVIVLSYALRFRNAHNSKD